MPGSPSFTGCEAMQGHIAHAIGCLPGGCADPVLGVPACFYALVTISSMEQTMWQAASHFAPGWCKSTNRVQTITNKAAHASGQGEW